MPANRDRNLHYRALPNMIPKILSRNVGKNFWTGSYDLLHRKDDLYANPFFAGYEKD